MRLEIDEKTLPDPFMIPGHAGVEILPTAGAHRKVKLVVFESGEIEGYAAPGSEVMAGDQVTTADFDGYFLIEKLRLPGTYEVTNGGRSTEATITRDRPIAVVKF